MSEYTCPACKSHDPHRYVMCQYAGCPDGRDARPKPVDWQARAEAAEARAAELDQKISEAAEWQREQLILNDDASALIKRQRAVIDDLPGRLSAAVEALEAIIDRSHNGELGTSKVIDMRNIAAALVASERAEEQSR